MYSLLADATLGEIFISALLISLYWFDKIGPFHVKKIVVSTIKETFRTQAMSSKDDGLVGLSIKSALT